MAMVVMIMRMNMRMVMFSATAGIAHGCSFKFDLYPKEKKLIVVFLFNNQGYHSEFIAAPYFRK